MGRGSAARAAAQVAALGFFPPKAGSVAAAHGYNQTQLYKDPKFKVRAWQLSRLAARLAAQSAVFP